MSCWGVFEVTTGWQHIAPADLDGCLSELHSFTAPCWCDPEVVNIPGPLGWPFGYQVSHRMASWVS